MWDWLDYIHQDGLLGYITALLLFATVYLLTGLKVMIQHDRRKADIITPLAPKPAYKPIHIEV